MTRSLGDMVRRLAGLLGKNDLNDWEARFVQSLCDRTHYGSDTRSLTDAQIDSMQQLFRKHFS